MSLSEWSITCEKKDELLFVRIAYALIYVSVMAILPQTNKFNSINDKKEEMHLATKGSPEPSSLVRHHRQRFRPREEIAN